MKNAKRLVVTALVTGVLAVLTASPAVAAPDAWLIDTLAGTGTAGFSGDGGPASEAEVYATRDTAVDASGNVYIRDSGNHRIRKVIADGTISTFRFQPDMRGGIAVFGGYLYYSQGVVWAKVYRVPLSGGPAEHVAGNGTPDHAGDGGPAVAAGLVPGALAGDQFGNLYVADPWNNRVRKVDTSGVIRTIAGSGTGRGFDTGDGGPAREAGLCLPNDVEVDRDANVFVATHCNRIRRIDRFGVIQTVAGTGQQGYSGDGGPATQASFNSTSGLAVDSTGNVFVADRLNHRIRMIDTSGTIRSIAGNGTGASAGDGGPARDAAIVTPDGLTIDPATRTLYVGSDDAHRVRRLPLVAPPIANDDAITTRQNVAVTGSLLSNDSGHNLEVLSVIGEPRGTLSVAWNGVFSYQPPADFSGTETFRYVVSDFAHRTDEATVTITVTPAARYNGIARR